MSDSPISSNVDPTPQNAQPQTESNTNEQPMQHHATPCNTPADSTPPKKLHYSQTPDSPPRTPKHSPDEFGNRPILANRENAKYPFRPDSQLAARPLDIPPLTNQQITSIDMLVMGRTDSQIAYALGIDRTTIWRWKTHHPLFRSELARKRNETWGAAGDRFRKLLFKALKSIKDQMNDEKALVRFRAAKTLLNFAAHNRFAPPEDSTDPNDYLNTFALKRRAEIHEPDFAKDPATDSERASALATLLAQSEDSTHYPPAPSIPPDPKSTEVWTEDGIRHKYPRR